MVIRLGVQALDDIAKWNLSFRNKVIGSKIEKNIRVNFQQLLIILNIEDKKIILSGSSLDINTLYLIKSNKKQMNSLKTNLWAFYCIINYEDISKEIALNELISRYKESELYMNDLEKNIDILEEENLDYSDDDLYNINSWGADLSFRELITMYKEGDLVKPELQRKYVWSKNEASRFIDSILLGLPVPSIFLAKEKNGIMLIVDGYQRIMTIHDFVDGIFGGDGKEFKLANTEIINARWRGKTFQGLTEEERRKIRNTTIHGIIFEQKFPKNDTGMYQIFERINTSGRALKPQEIRNCVYQGAFNTLLFELNKDQNWRAILNFEEDARMTDLELILRFFAINEINERAADQTQINLTKYLNSYMGDKVIMKNDEILTFKENFKVTMRLIYQGLGNKAFRKLKSNQRDFTNKISPAIFDAIAVASYEAIKLGVNIDKEKMMENYINLLKDEDFLYVTSNRTTNIENIVNRINLAERYLYGITYERRN